MTVPIAIEVTGVEEVVERIGGIADRVGKLRPAFEVVADLLEGHVAKTFATQGSRIGQAWQALAVSTVRARTNRTGYYGLRGPSGAGPAGPVLQWSGRLLRSFRRGGVAHFRRVSDTGLIWGSGVRYGVFHQSKAPRSRLPRRPMLGFRDEFQRREVLFQPIRMYLQGVEPGAIRAVMGPRLGL